MLVTCEPGCAWAKWAAPGCDNQNLSFVWFNWGCHSPFVLHSVLPGIMFKGVMKRARFDEFLLIYWDVPWSHWEPFLLLLHVTVRNTYIICKENGAPSAKSTSTKSAIPKHLAWFLLMIMMSDSGIKGNSCWPIWCDPIGKSIAVMPLARKNDLIKEGWHPLTRTCWVLV